MLIELSIGNYRSFRNEFSLSMVAAGIASKPAVLDTSNVFSAGEVHLLTSAAIYGANAAGKSTIISALSFMRRFVLTSARETQVSELIPVEPFRLNTVTAEQPTHFEVVFLLDGVQYRYGFDVTPRRVMREWLYRLGKAREIVLFLREHDSIEV